MYIDIRTILLYALLLRNEKIYIEKDRCKISAANQELQNQQILAQFIHAHRHSSHFGICIAFKK